jgi:hypothetical protein
MAKLDSTQKALALLEECLYDEQPWSALELAARLEEVYLALGGTFASARS